MEIRSYNDEDAATLAALWRRIFQDSRPHNDPLNSIRRKLAFDGKSLVLVAVENRRMIGAVMGGYDGHRGWIYSLAVDPEYRRQGVATALVQRVELKLRDLGCPKVNLQVRSSNHEVVTFYEKLGYETEPRVSMGKLLA